MKYGMNLLLWTDDPTLERWLPLYERLKGMGFDGVELPLMGATPERFAALGRRLEDMGLERTAVNVRSVEEDPIATEASIRSAAAAGLEFTIDCAEAAGARLLAGPLYAALGRFSGAGPSPEEWERGVAAMRQAADYAAGKGISLALEFLNRFELYLLNCSADTLRFVGEVGRKNVGVHYDTFHAHIEEKDPAAAILAAGRGITHVHISESDRSTPGKGQVRWAETFEALQRTGYEGWLTIEAFGLALPSLAAATRIWRPMFEDEEKLCQEGLVFMKTEWERGAPH
ncbi:MAG: sugar phosphate isomerase/epimerase [Deltaproteobacteria bacterium]|nr:sugar phosphate isomerase/epimerase [Deltaproteobacteria bacterium]MBW2418976.1 sugar phosphate isomerase/epimerase [Deltaproteobacteria bacterium]